MNNTLSVHILAALLLTSFAASHAADEAPIVGAIRWDGWYGDGGVVNEVEHSLGQPKYHFRLPWFAQIGSEGKAGINGDSQVIMEQEIAYAAQAGLNYWAFLDYLDEAPGMSIGLKRYLDAKDKKGIRYCLVEEGGRIDKAGTKAWSKLVEHFRSPDYQTVLDGRPLLCLNAKTNKLGKAEWDELKRQSIAAGLKAPYLVLMGWEVEKDRKALGFDAISEYACAGKGYTTDPETYSRLTSHHVSEKLWDKWKRERTPCITFATAGWDTRPRQERPPSWCSWVKATPDPTPLAQQKPLIDATTATPDEIAAHVRAAMEWTKANRDLNPANAIILYAWNEHDEGGWLQPTLGADGKPNDARIKALEKVFRAPALLKP
ncbi:MAG: glycoside hydrolase family 99-like domain-containing protein [Prosthecobacter sp.]|uniref:glycoside hydrolase family 99-like domain-containing protein n=1 Tax=Prosthecobacter sp. TaxID=1965333 RepID=UPI00390428EF